MAATSADEVGLDMKLSLEVAGGDIEYFWAQSVIQILTPEHRAKAEAVKSKHPVPGCSKCGDTGKCARCYWPHVVMYWRNLEMQGKYAEGYTFANSMKMAVKRGLRQCWAESAQHFCRAEEVRAETV